MRLLKKAQQFVLSRQPNVKASVTSEYSELLLAYLQGRIRFSQVHHALKGEKTKRGNTLTSTGSVLGYLIGKVQQEGAFERVSFSPQRESRTETVQKKYRKQNPCIMCGSPVAEPRKTCSQLCRNNRSAQVQKEYIRNHPEKMEKLWASRRNHADQIRERVVGSALTL